jgi:co-chaperonin GroES (HSP10)
MQPINKYIVIESIEEQVATSYGLMMTSSDTEMLALQEGSSYKAWNERRVREGR